MHTRTRVRRVGGRVASAAAVRLARWSLALGATLAASGGCEERAPAAEPTATAPAAEQPVITATGFSASLAAELGSGGGSGSAGSGSGVVPNPGPAAGSASAPGAEIKLALAPGWERDVAGVGTISRRVRVESTGREETFVVAYGHDAPGAPTDREAYKRFLGDQNILRVARDRQLGAAWYLEGVDGKGKPAFRFLVSYGGERLVCHGSLYRDSKLGDVRDEVMIQAKKICESIQL